MAKEQEKSIFLLFQEVQGCSTCKNYGREVLSDPLLVKIIEEEFISLVIYNNKGGKDKEILNHYQEPSWNNPVVPILDAEGKNLIPRMANDYSKKKVALQLIHILRNAHKTVPDDLIKIAQGWTL